MKRIIVLGLMVMIAGCSRDPRAARDKYIDSAQEYMKKGRYEEAAIQFRNAIDLDKGYVASYVGLAKALQQLDDQAGAISIYRRVMTLDSKNIEAKLQMCRYMLAAAMQEPDLFKKAQEIAEEILKQDPANLDARIMLGNAYAGLNDSRNALQEMQKALAADPGNISAYLTIGSVQMREQNAEKAEQTFREILGKHPESVQAQLAMGGFYAATKRPELAEPYFRKAFELEGPRGVMGLYSLVAFYSSAQRPQQAEAAFREAIGRWPEAREPRWGFANYLIQNKRFDEGTNILRDMVKRNSGDRIAQLRLAEVCLFQKRDQDADAILKALLSANKGDAEAHYLQGRMLILRGQNDKALEEFSAANKYKEWLIPPYLFKAALLMGRGDLDGAQEALQQTLRRDRNNLPAHAGLAKVFSLQGKFQAAQTESDLVLQKQPANEDALMARAEALRGLGKLDQAGLEFSKLAELAPQNPFYRHRLGWIELAKGKTDLALPDLRKALELNPRFSPALNDILYIYTNAKQFDAALAELNRLAGTSIPADEISVLRGRIYMGKRDWNSAAQAFRKAIEGNPHNYQAYILMGQVHQQMGSPAQALQDVEQLLAKNNRYAPAFLLKGIYLEAAKDYRGAISNYRETLKLDSGNAIAANNLAWLLCETGQDTGEALSLAQTARKSDPKNPEIADTLGWIYYRQKSYALAVDQLLFSINNRPTPSAENYYRLGMACYAKGDIMQAKQSLRKALELNPALPDSSSVRKILSSAG